MTFNHAKKLKRNNFYCQSRNLLILCRSPCNNGSNGAATNGSNNGKIGEMATEEPLAKKSKTENNGASSPLPREPFDVAQLKSYGKLVDFSEKMVKS